MSYPTPFLQYIIESNKESLARAIERYKRDYERIRELVNLAKNMDRLDKLEFLVTLIVRFYGEIMDWRDWLYHPLTQIILDDDELMRLIERISQALLMLIEVNISHCEWFRRKLDEVLKDETKSKLMIEILERLGRTPSQQPCKERDHVHMTHHV